MRIAEIFRSLQGEGRLTGVDSVFIRVSGCNLRCRYCDTTYASWSPDGEHLSVEEVLTAMENVWGARPASRPLPTMQAWCPSGARPVPNTLRHVVVTGGEPMLFPDVVPLCAELRRRGMHVTMETAGTRYQPVQCDLMAVSPKLSNSTPCTDDAPNWADLHERHRTAPDVLRRLNTEYDCQFKFVVGSPADCDEVRDYLLQFPEIDHRRVFLMPMGTQQTDLAAIGQWLEPLCRERGYIFCPRRHIEWFGCCRGT
jgi:7-carboxy-7-deazaguanine synthase